MPKRKETVYKDELYFQRDVGRLDHYAPVRPHGSSLLQAILATAFFGCWHIIAFFALWAAAVSIANHHHYSISFQPTLLTVCVYHFNLAGLACIISESFSFADVSDLQCWHSSRYAISPVSF